MRRVKPFDLLDDEVYVTACTGDYLTCDEVYCGLRDGTRPATMPLSKLALKHSTSYEDEDETDLPNC